jgi:hypothetical protein
MEGGKPLTQMVLTPRTPSASLAVNEAMTESVEGR